MCRVLRLHLPKNLNKIHIDTRCLRHKQNTCTYKKSSLKSIFHLSIEARVSGGTRPHTLKSYSCRLAAKVRKIKDVGISNVHAVFHTPHFDVCAKTRLQEWGKKLRDRLSLRTAARESNLVMFFSWEPDQVPAHNNCKTKCANKLRMNLLQAYMATCSVFLPRKVTKSAQYEWTSWKWSKPYTCLEMKHAIYIYLHRTSIHVAAVLHKTLLHEAREKTHPE